MVEQSGEANQKGGNANEFINFNLLMVGDSGVGKTSILNRYVKKKFDINKIATSGVDFQLIKYVSADGDKCRVKIWDTVGQERYRNLTSSFFKDADGAIIVYDLTSSQTFFNVKDWINSFYKMKGKELPMAVVGNKLDLCSPGLEGGADGQPMDENQREVSP